MRICVIFTVTILVLFVHVSAKTDCKVKLAKCESRKPIPRIPVCGTDDQTYPHRCALLKTRCTKNSSLSVKYKGRCREKRPCFVDRNKKLNANHSNKNQPNMNSDYIPDCLTDGTYAPVQCHTSMGYCWCVTPNGKMIPRSTMARHRKLECPKRGKSSTTSKNSTDDTVNFSKKGCDQTDKDIFVNNLVRIFKTEYNRDAFGKQNYVTSKENTTLESNAIQWKFSTLDKDKNNSLTKNEYRDLRKLIKKVVKPRRCSRAFIRLCDVDHNSKISKDEWTNCLSIDRREVGNKTLQEETPQKSTGEDSMGEINGFSMSESQVDLSGADEFVGKASIFPLVDHSPIVEKESEEKADCLSDRKTVLEEFKLVSQEAYVPECTPDGLYKKKQCYPATGYCWCVLEDSGKPIPGTSVRNSDPNCDSIPQPPRPMKGCPDQKKVTFIQDLMVFFERNLTTNTELSDREYNSTENQKKLEQLASLSFHNLDSNKNDVLDRREWKSFRAMMATSKTMKRCGRKFPRYCDSNHDYKITKNEWIRCLNLQVASPSVGTQPSTTNPRRRGPNPIESYLKDY